MAVAWTTGMLSVKMPAFVPRFLRFIVKRNMCNLRETEYLMWHDVTDFLCFFPKKNPLNWILAGIFMFIPHKFEGISCFFRRSVDPHTFSGKDWSFRWSHEYLYPGWKNMEFTWIFGWFQVPTLEMLLTSEMYLGHSNIHPAGGCKNKCFFFVRPSFRGVQRVTSIKLWYGGPYTYGYMALSENWIQIPPQNMDI